MKFINPQAKGLAFGLSTLLAEKMSAYAPGHKQVAGPTAAYLVTRCPDNTVAQTSIEGVCSCAAMTAGGTLCEGYGLTDRQTICVEDLRHGKRQPTCGLEFATEPEACPISFQRLVTDPNPAYICQDIASQHSCGITHTDCTRTKGALQTQCFEGFCEILMCKEGWRFKLTDDGTAACVPAKPLFFGSKG